MKRFHVHLSVPDLAASVRFYSHLFGSEPTIQKTDYAKWMLDDPRVNFAISTWNETRGINHLGLQADSDEELSEIGARFATADKASLVAEPDAHCCYAVSDKHWVQDPQGIAWEAFHTLTSVPTFDVHAQAANESVGCCDTQATAAARPQTSCGAATVETSATGARSCCA